MKGLNEMNKELKTNNINKPLTIVCEDFKAELTRLVNETPMPLFVIESIMKDIISLVHNATQQQLAMDRETYNNAVSNAATNDDEK